MNGGIALGFVSVFAGGKSCGFGFVIERRSRVAFSASPPEAISDSKPRRAESVNVFRRRSPVWLRTGRFSGVFSHSKGSGPRDLSGSRGSVSRAFPCLRAFFEICGGGLAFGRRFLGVSFGSRALILRPFRRSDLIRRRRQESALLGLCPFAGFLSVAAPSMSAGARSFQPSGVGRTSIKTARGLMSSSRSSPGHDRHASENGPIPSCWSRRHSAFGAGIPSALGTKPTTETTTLEGTTPM